MYLGCFGLKYVPVPSKPKLTLHANAQEVYDDLVARERRLRAAEADLAEAAAERERALGEREAAASAVAAERAAALRVQARGPARLRRAGAPRAAAPLRTLPVLWETGPVMLGLPREAHALTVKDLVSLQTMLKYQT
jgi:hypothetical protein